MKHSNYSVTAGKTIIYFANISERAKYITAETQYTIKELNKFHRCISKSDRKEAQKELNEKRLKFASSKGYKPFSKNDQVSWVLKNG